MGGFPEPNPAITGKLVIVFPWPVSDDAKGLVRKAFPNLKVIFQYTLWANTNLAEDIPDEEWKDVDFLLASSSLPNVELAPKIRFIQLVSAGANHIVDHPFFKDTKVPICAANGVHAPQIAEWVVATFLSHQHRLITYLDGQRQRKWERLSEPIYDAVKQRVGILGYGAIGRQVARVAVALGMDVHAYTLHPKHTPESRRDHGYVPGGLGDVEGAIPSKWYSGESKKELHEFLGSGLDLLVVALPLTPKTQHLISREEFEVLSEKKTFISNIARGAVIKTTDLIEALEKGLVSGAALDVAEKEPLPEDDPLWDAKNVIITPHISSSSEDTPTRVLEVLIQNLTRLHEGKDLINLVDRKEKY